ncbi:MAG: 4-hydroxy-tetrahydrodipicolinate reductase [Bacteroidota bacterium]|jgi:4-hydroxy-tetrahydrodipicolinate reductase
MKIALIGNGKMGKTIASLLAENGHEIHSIFNRDNVLTSEKLKGADVAIEFTIPSECLKHISICFNAQVPVIVGTTGWYDQYHNVISKMTESNAILCATNFSIGVQALFHLNKELSRILNRFGGYKACLTEIHHTAKLDKPSGTALTLAQGIIEESNAYSNWHLKENDGGEKSLPIEALREANVPGTHEVIFKSDIDTITLKHEAHNRLGFALGAIRAAEFIQNKKGVFTMSDVLNS